MYLTFDVGTTSVKVVLYEHNGRLIDKVIRNYSLETTALNWYEEDPEIYWEAVVKGIQEIIARQRVPASAIQSLSGCSQGETVIFLDKRDVPVRPAIVWLDQRARAEVEELSRFISNEELYRVTGLTEMDVTWSAAKILWVKHNEPEVFAAPRSFSLSKTTSPTDSQGASALRSTCFPPRCLSTYTLAAIGRRPLHTWVSPKDFRR